MKCSLGVWVSVGLVVCQQAAGQFSHGGSSKLDKLVQTNLKKKIEADFVNMPAARIVRALKESTRCDIIVDWDEVGRAGADQTTALTIRSKGAPAKAVLDVLCRRLCRYGRLVWYIDRGAVCVTTWQGLSQKTDMRSYADLSRAEADLVRPVACWNVRGATVMQRGGKYFATAPPLGHQLIREFLRLARGGMVRADWERVIGPYAALREAEITVEWTDKPAIECIAELREKTGVPILLDDRRCQAAGVKLTGPVKLSLEQASGEEALDSLLEAMKPDGVLTADVIADGMALFITTTKEADMHLAALEAGPVLRKKLNVKTLHEVVAAVQKEVEPELWSGKGGRSRLEAVTDGRLMCLAPADQLTAVAEFLEVPVALAVLSGTRPKAPTGPASRPVLSRSEIAARRWLVNAKLDLRDDRKRKAVLKLYDILRRYPNTKAAREAKELLETLK